MATVLIDPAGPRKALLAGQHLADGGAVWAAGFLQTAALACGLQFEIKTVSPTEAGAWPVELRISDRPFLLVDIDVNGTGHAWLDRLELRAAQVWRDVTREAAVFEPRPWLAAVRISDAPEPDQDGVDRLAQLVAARVLDVACILLIDEASGRVWSPNPATSLEALQAATLGRCQFLANTGL